MSPELWPQLGPGSAGLSSDDFSFAQPRHRFMSAYEQRQEPADKNYQYILVAAAPYETVAFKVPNR